MSDSPTAAVVLAMFVVLQIPLKRLVRELIPGKRGPGEDVAEALVQGSARITAVILASTFVRGLAGDRGPGTDRAEQEDHGAAKAGLEASLDQQRSKEREEVRGRGPKGRGIH